MLTVERHDKVENKVIVIDLRKNNNPGTNNGTNKNDKGTLSNLATASLNGEKKK